MAIAVTEARFPARGCGDPRRPAAARDKALRYMDLEPGRPLLGKPIDVVFVGSCTNGRLSDLHGRRAASFKGERCRRAFGPSLSPGSERVKKRAEAEGLDRIFLAAGAEWREPGCSMCIAMNGDALSSPGSTAGEHQQIRNFEGRQGRQRANLLPRVPVDRGRIGHRRVRRRPARASPGRGEAPDERALP